MSAVPPTRPGRPPVAVERHLGAVREDDLFAGQWTPSSNLPDPTALIENLARGVIEAMSGARDLEQMGRWMTETVYKNLLRRSILAARGRAVRRQVLARPTVHIAARRMTSPADGVVEAALVVHGQVRTRAVAMRLEGIDSRWRATAIHVL